MSKEDKKPMNEVKVWTHRCFCGLFLTAQSINAMISTHGSHEIEVYVGTRLRCPKWSAKHEGPEMQVNLLGDGADRNYGINCNSGAVYALSKEIAAAIRTKAENAPKFEWRS